MAKLKEKLSNFAKENKRYIIFVSIVWAFFMFLVFLAPFSGDDWAWGTEMGISRVKSFFFGYNGRFAGNYLICLLSRSELLQVLVVSLSMIAVCILPLFITRNKSLSVFSIGVLMIFLMPHTVFVQCIMWASGYTNYMPPTIIVLFYLAIVANVLNKEEPSYTKKQTICVGFMGFLGALFMENVTIYNLLVAITIVVYSKIKFKRTFKLHITYLVSTIAGMILMFANSAYFKAANGTDFYRSFAWKNFEMIFSHLNFLSVTFFAKGFLVFIFISALCIPLIIRALKGTNDKREQVKLYSVLAVNLCTLFIICAKQLFGSWEIFYKHSYTSIIAFGLVVVLHFLSIFLTILFTVKDLKPKIILSFLLVSVPLLLGPFLIISPLNARCVMPAYIVLSVFVSILFDYIRTSFALSCQSARVIAISALSLSLGMYLFFVNIYAVVRKYEYLRIEYIEKQVEAGITEEVVLTHLPYSSYVWMETPFENNALWEGHFKKFYNLDKDITFKNVSVEEFDQWRKEFDKAHK